MITDHQAPPTQSTPKTREIALDLAVQLHGMANHAEKSVPAKAGTVLATAQDFELYLLDGTIRAGNIR